MLDWQETFFVYNRCAIKNGNLINDNSRSIVIGSILYFWNEGTRQGMFGGSGEWRINKTHNNNFTCKH